jgi:hypothetical protein
VDEWQEFVAQARKESREAKADALTQEVLRKATQNC